MFCSSTFKNVTANDCSEVIKQTVPNQISINSTNLGQKKGPYDQFKFPSSDPPLTKAGKMEITKLESLEYLVNLMAGKLQPDLNPYKYGLKILVESTGGGKKVHWILLQIARLTDHPPK